MSKHHTDREYGEHLGELRESLLSIAQLVEEMIDDATRALIQGDVELAQETIRKDRRVNQRELEIDELCTLILAKWQPVAVDLRFVTIALKMVTDLERIGDLAVNLCERTIDHGGAFTEFDVSESWQEMSDLVRGMIRMAIEAFFERDAERARAVLDADDRVDELYSEVFRVVLAEMQKDPSIVQQGTHMVSILKWMERMGDHATNIAEHVVFMVRGQDIRHEGKLPRRASVPGTKPTPK